MKANEKLKEQVLEIVKNQISNNDPEETKATFERLKKEGINESVAFQLIGQCLALELFDVLKFKRPYNRDRYINNLNLLPKESSV
jgi:hypothetical protein